MKREFHVRFCENAGVKFPCVTRLANQRKEHSTLQIDHVLLNKSMTDKTNELNPDHTLPTQSVLFFFGRHTKILNEVLLKNAK